jgi:pimeloyl-ACP methyl ester carboxylesterase
MSRHRMRLHPVLRRSVHSGEVELAVRESGDHARPSIVAVHGYPDTAAVWDPVAQRLAGRFHVVAYDVRGAGASSTPARRQAYSLARLVDDLVAVLDAVLPPGKQAHLLGHDWGSVQLWEAVLTEAEDARLTGRIASFTSISGPSLDDFGAFLRSGWRRDRVFAVTGQALRSWYAGFFQLPVLPELAWRGVVGPFHAALRRSDRLGRRARRRSTLPQDGAHGVNLYRANAGRLRLREERSTRVPVQLVVLRRDAFLRPPLFAGLDRRVERLERVDVDAGHWAMHTHPDLLAELVAGFVERTGPG